MKQAGCRCGEERPIPAPVEAVPRTLGCRAPRGVVRTRPRPARVARRRLAVGTLRALGAVREHPALGGQGRWVAEGAVFPAALDRDPPPPCPQGDAGWHCHEKHRVLVVVDGLGRLHTEEGAFALRPSDVAVLAPGRLHRLQAHGEPMTLLTVEFFPGSALTPAEQPLLHRVFGGEPVIHCAHAAAAEAQSLLHRIRAEQRRERDAGTLAVRAYMTSLLVLLYRRRGRRPADGDRTAPDAALREVRGYMEEHFRHALRVSELAAQAHLSPRQFTARFKAAFGETPGRYLTRIRVAAAQELLCTSDMGVAQVARAVGYENLSHFYRTFVQHAGTSPGRYRLRPPDVPGAPDRTGATL